MRKVIDILSETSLFSSLKTKYSDLYTTLFGDVTTDSLDNKLIFLCGQRYASALLSQCTIEQVVTNIVITYSVGWERIKEVLSYNYDITKPYDMTKTTKEERDTTGKNENETNNSQSVFSFDETEPTNTNTEKDTTKGNTTEHTVNEITITNTGNNNSNITNMIQDEIKMRHDSFITLVMTDIKNLISLDIY